MLKGLFGPSHVEVWRQLADQLHGKFIEGGFLHSAKVEASAGPWTLTLDTFIIPAGNAMIPCTSLRAPFVNHDGFRFTIYRASLFSKVGKAFGMQDIEVGDDFFDETFIIKANDESKVRKLFADRELRKLIQAQPSFELKMRDVSGSTAELYFHAVGVITNIEQLRGLYDVFARCLDRLSEIGCATKD